MKRPALSVFIILILSIIAQRYLTGGWLMLSVIFVFIVNFAGYFKTKNKFFFILCVIFSLFLLVNSNMEYKLKDIGRDGIATCVVKDISYTTNDNIKIVADEVVFESDGNKTELNGRAVIYAKDNNYIKINDVIKAECKILRNKNKAAGFNNEEYMLFNNIEFSSVSNNIEIIGHKKAKIRDYISALSRKSSEIIDEIYSKREAGILKAILVGNTSDLKDSDREVYEKAGISHILSISGLHITIISAMLIKIFELFKLDKRRSSVLVVLFLIFYATFAGARASVIRSTIMVSIVLLSKLFYRKHDTINSMGFAGIIILLLNPYSLFTAGFQLSFISVTAILMFMEYLDNTENSFIRKIANGVLLSVFISIFTFPVTAYHFYKVPVYGFVSNLFVIPILGLLTGTGFISLIVGFISKDIAAILSVIPVYILKYIDFICGFVGSLKFSEIVTGKPTIAFILIFYLIFIGFVKAEKKDIIISIILCIAGAIVSFSNGIFKTNSVYFMNSDYSKGAIAKLYDNRVFMFSNESPSDSLKDHINIDEFVNSIGKEDIDAVFISGTDSKDIRFAIKMIKYGLAADIYVPEVSDMDTEVLEFVAKEYGANIYMVSAGDVAYVDDDISVSYIYPYKDISEEIGGKGSIILFDDRGRRYMFVGDLEENDMRFIMHSGMDIKCDVLYIDGDITDNKYLNEFIDKTGAEKIISSDSEVDNARIFDTDKRDMITFKKNIFD